MTEDENTTKTSCCAQGRASKGHGFLYGSMALNLFLLGLVVGPFLGGRPLPPPPGPMDQGVGGRHMDRPGPGMFPGFVLDRLSHEMPKADGDKLREIYADASANLKGKREASRESFQKIAEILKQEKPDLAALQAALDTLQAEGQGFHAEMSKALKRVATEMPLESRQKIAAFIERGPLRHRMGPPEGDGPRPNGEQGLQNQGQNNNQPPDDRPHDDPEGEAPAAP